MKNDNYSCDYCGDIYIPTRKGVQRFCKSNCRKKYSYHKNKDTTKPKPKEEISQKLDKLQNKKMKVEEMSAHGVANAALGILAVNTATALAKKIFVSEDKNPATKGDIQELKNLINTRYFLVHNINPDPFGRKAYFDIGTGKILYLDENSNKFHLPQFIIG